MFKSGFGIATPFSAGPSKPRNYGQQGGVDLQAIGTATGHKMDKEGNISLALGEAVGKMQIIGAAKEDWNGCHPPNWKGDVILLCQANPHRLKHRPVFDMEDLGQRGRGNKDWGRYKATCTMWIDDQEVVVEAATYKKRQSLREASAKMLATLKSWDPPLAKMGLDEKGNFKKTGGLTAQLQYMDDKLGLGFDYTRKGWRVTEIAETPGQPGLMVGDLITEIGGEGEKVSLVDMEQPDQVAIFKAELHHMCEITVFRDTSSLQKEHAKNRLAAQLMNTQDAKLKLPGTSACSVLWRWWKRNRQECPQAPRYEFIGHEGQVHERIHIFACKVTYKGHPITARAARPKKKDAEKSAANAMVCKLQGMGINVDPHGLVQPEESTDMGDIHGKYEDPDEMLLMLSLVQNKLQMGHEVKFEIGTNVDALNPADSTWIEGGQVSQLLPDAKYKIFWPKWKAYSDHAGNQVRSMDNFKISENQKVGERLFTVYCSYAPDADKSEFFDGSKRTWDAEKLAEFVKAEKKKYGSKLGGSAADEMVSGGGKYSLAGTGLVDFTQVGVNPDPGPEVPDERDIMSQAHPTIDRNIWARQQDIEVPPPDKNGKIHCAICGIWLNGPSPYKNHVLGKKHGWRVRDIEREKDRQERLYGQDGFGQGAYAGIGANDVVMDLSGDAPSPNSVGMGMGMGGGGQPNYQLGPPVGGGGGQIGMGGGQIGMGAGGQVGMGMGNQNQGPYRGPPRRGPPARSAGSDQARRRGGW